uniref:Venom protein 4.1 n=1 Tax=Lychas mucronatus TaxID=172552 RepID=NDBL_LYCMC|nr:RecName: Full=Venom protein 4.1; Flags: Precursor [Lychas mucronatus]
MKALCAILLVLFACSVMFEHFSISTAEKVLQNPLSELKRNCEKADCRRSLPQNKQHDFKE